MIAAFVGPQSIAPNPSLRGVSVVLPAYNEEKNVARTVGEVLRVVGPAVDDLEVIVVDDGSRDATSRVVEEVGDPRVRVVRHERNQGYGAAVWTGFRAARCPFVFLTDADGQFEIEDLEKFLPLIDSHDLIIGYRAHRADPPIRVLNGVMWRVVINAAFGYTARDIDCAFKLIRREVVETCDVTSRGAMMSAELLVKARAAGFRVAEVAVRHRPRVAGTQTGGNPAVILRALRELASFRIHFNKRTYAKQHRTRRE